MFITRYKVLLLLTLVVFINQAKKSSVRISGAQLAGDLEYPYVVQISFIKSDNERSLSFCTGSVIAPRWTLTAGHCLPGMKLQRHTFVVTYQENTTNGIQSVSRTVEETVKYPAYNIIGANDNDLGLIKHQLLKLKEYGKISSINYQSLMGQPCIVAGYGAVDEDNTIYADMLQVLDGVVITCQTIFMLNKIQMFDSRVMYPNFCVARRCTANIGVICSGDSGGPLIHASGIIGISSQSFDCSSPGTKEVGIFVPLSVYINWIKTIVTKTEKISRYRATDYNSRKNMLLGPQNSHENEQEHDQPTNVKSVANTISTQSPGLVRFFSRY